MRKSGSPQVYLAGPLGFSESGKLFYYQKLVPLVVEMGFSVLDPWALTSKKILNQVITLPYGPKKKDKWHSINKVIGRNNADAIKKCNLIVACLDGTDVDSGTAAEIGYGAALGKPIIGYRSDFRLAGDNDGAIINLQMEYFIKLNGGTISFNLKELKELLKCYFKKF